MRKKNAQDNNWPQEEREDEAERRRTGSGMQRGRKKKPLGLGAQMFLKIGQGYFSLFPISVGCTSNNVGCT